MVTPLVTCVMPTRNRRRFVSRAIWYFLRQDYPRRDLVVVDDGDEPVADLLPDDGRIRYLRVSPGTPAGRKRNLGCIEASGEILAHWDDDAWYSPRRLSAQVEQLENGSEVTALRGTLHYQPVTGRLWSYDGNGRSEPLAAVAHTRQIWERNPFAERASGEIAAFIRGVPEEALHVANGSDLAVTLLHGSGTGSVNVTDPRWRPRPFGDLSRLMEADVGFYATLRNAPQVPRSRVPVPVTVAATFMVYDGYGSMAEYLTVGLARTGVDVQVLPFRIDPEGMSQEFLDLWRRSRPATDDVTLCHAWWGEDLLRFGGRRDLFVKTVWETSLLPRDWPARLQAASAVIVPSRFAADVFRSSGVKSPVEVVHEGIDPAVYPYVDRLPRRGLTTLVVGVLTPRKNFREAIAAWKLAFADDPDARLILKARFQLEDYVPDDPRVRVVDSNETTRGILDWYRQADVLMALGNEGFGLPLLEGMATGLPAVALDSEAQADVCRDARGMVLPVPPARWEPVESPLLGPCGVRGIPDVEVAAQRLRWVADHREEARLLGRRASRWVHAHRNVWAMAPAVADVMERHSRTRRPLRRSYALWAETGESAGVAYYLQDLRRTHELARIHKEAPAAWRSRCLHVQRERVSIDGDNAARSIEAARRDGIPVVLTEHSAGAGREIVDACDVLVAVDDEGAAFLRQKWPGKRIEVIPLPCPPWRPSRRAGGGRTAAVVGAGGRIAGATRDAVAGGCSEVVVIDRPHEGASGDDMAALLNREADVVVMTAPSRYLARVALASGAPLVLSPEARQADLAGVAWQPGDLTAGVCRVLTDRALRTDLAVEARRFCREHDWREAASLHRTLWSTLSP